MTAQIAIARHVLQLSHEHARQLSHEHVRHLG
jgi:hypothetical protein